MTTHSARIEDSLQIALSKLRRIETTRDAAAREASPRERLEPEAGAQEHRIDLERQRRELERLQLPSSSLGRPALLAAVMALAVIGGGIVWYQQHRGEAGRHHGAAALDRAESEPTSMELELERAQSALDKAKRRAANLQDRLSNLERKPRAPQEEASGRDRRAGHGGRGGRAAAARPERTRPERTRPERTRIVIDRECKDGPLGCAR